MTCRHIPADLTLKLTYVDTFQLTWHLNWHVTFQLTWHLNWHVTFQLTCHLNWHMSTYSSWTDLCRHTPVLSKRNHTRHIFPHATQLAATNRAHSSTKRTPGWPNTAVSQVLLYRNGPLHFRLSQRWWERPKFLGCAPVQTSTESPTFRQNRAPQ